MPEFRFLPRFSFRRSFAISRCLLDLRKPRNSLRANIQAVQNRFCEATKKGEKKLRKGLCTGGEIQVTRLTPIESNTM